MKPWPTLQELWAHASLFHQFTHAYGTDYVKIWKNRHKISVYPVRIFLQCIVLRSGDADSIAGKPTEGDDGNDPLPTLMIADDMCR